MSARPAGIQEATARVVVRAEARHLHHAPGGGFRNPWPGSELPGVRDILRVVVEYWSQTRGSKPSRGMFPVSPPAIHYPRAREGHASATWVGHSTVLLQLGRLNLLTDPVFSQRAFPVQWLGQRRIMDPAVSLEALPPIDVVLQSHNHYDHLDRHAVEAIADANPMATWVVPLGLGEGIQRWGARNVVELDWWNHAVIGGVRITATPARHFSGRGIGDRNRTLWCGFALDADEARVFFAGDTAYHPDFSAIGARCGPFDLVMIPIGAYDPRWMMEFVHANPEEAVRIYQDLSAAHPNHQSPIMLGIHWGTFRLTIEAIDEPPRRAVARWRELELDEDRLWIARFGETRQLGRSIIRQY